LGKVLLEMKNICKSFSGVSVLKDNHLELEAGEVHALLGENGAGKTTTIKLILDIIKKDSGSIRILGRDCTSATTILKEEIGVVLDEVGFQECLTPLQIGRIMKDIFHTGILLYTTNISKNLTFQIKKNLVSFQKE